MSKYPIINNSKIENNPKNCHNNLHLHHVTYMPIKMKRCSSHRAFSTSNKNKTMISKSKSRHTSISMPRDKVMKCIGRITKQHYTIHIKGSKYNIYAQVKIEVCDKW